MDRERGRRGDQESSQASGSWGRGEGGGGERLQGEIFEYR